MFWGSFSGSLGLGPGFFWEKAWGSINQETYVEHTVPDIILWIRHHPELYLMQDNASPHVAKYTREVLSKMGVKTVFWPAFSPDLNPIESLWDLMKDWIATNYIMEDLKVYSTLRKAVTEAWAAIGKDLLDHLIALMPQRCQAVIDANGMQTKY